MKIYLSCSQACDFIGYFLDILCSICKFGDCSDHCIPLEQALNTRIVNIGNRGLIMDCRCQMLAKTHESDCLRLMPGVELGLFSFLP